MQKNGEVHKAGCVSSQCMISMLSYRGFPSINKHGTCLFPPIETNVDSASSLLRISLYTTSFLPADDMQDMTFLQYGQVSIIYSSKVILFLLYYFILCFILCFILNLLSSLPYSLSSFLLSSSPFASPSSSNSYVLYFSPFRRSYRQGTTSRVSNVP